MASSTFTERVLAACGPDDDDHYLDNDDRVSSPCRPLSCREKPAGSLDTLAASSRPTENSAGNKASSYHAPFDPEDQSDDEVVVSSVYKREIQADRATGVSVNGKDGKKTASGSGSNTPGSNLSATARSFTPSADEHKKAAIPLVEIPSPKGLGKFRAERGKVYPGRRVPFCPWTIVENYHIWFVGKQNGERVEAYFEKEELLRCQSWDFCYVWHPDKEKADIQILLVPTSQFQHLLDRINETLHIQLTIPPGTFAEKFNVIFGQQQTPIPRFLGRARDAAAFDTLVESMPPPNPADAVLDNPKIEAKVAQSYVKKIEKLLAEHSKEKHRKKKSDKNRTKRLLNRRAAGRQIKRVQRFMGLRQKRKECAFRGAIPFDIPDVSDDARAPPFPQEKEVVFVAMDIESYEFNHNAITEIGFGILDSRDLAGVPPGLKCQNWMAQIQGRHLRILEHASMVNRRHVHGWEKNFNFGKSEFVSLKDILSVVTDILQPKVQSGEKRHVVLVGHDIQNDINLVKNIGFHVTEDMFLEIVDTQDFYQHLRMSNQQAGLKSVLDDLEIEHVFLHNGGNDAVYTLQALIRLVIKKRQDSLRRYQESLLPGYTPDPAIVAEGWESGGEMSDGGPGHSGLQSSCLSTSAKKPYQKNVQHETPRPDAENGALTTSIAEVEDLIDL